MSRVFRFGFFALLACGASATTVIAVTLGGETDTITRSPAASSYLVEAVDRAGNRQALADGGWTPETSVDLGSLSPTIVASIQLTASEANGSPVVWGAVPFAVLGVFDGQTIPLFIQRKGDTARMPNTADDRNAPLLATSARTIYSAGGNLGVSGYDMLFLQAAATCAVPGTASSFALVVSPYANSDEESAMAWTIDDGGASVTGLSHCTLGYEKLVSLDGGAKGSAAWGDFAGGRTVMGDDGSAYIVGQSRLSAFSGTIFKIAPDPDASTLVNALITSVALNMRKGAATAWAPARGVFIYGGSSAAPGDQGEIVSASGAVTEIKGTDTREGLAAIAMDANKMLVAGDDQLPVVVDLTGDLSCTACPTQTWGMALPMKLTSPALFALGNSAFLIVGDDPSGATRLFRMTEFAAPLEKPLKIARQGARAIQFETGQIVIIGGGSATPESYAD